MRIIQDGPRIEHGDACLGQGRAIGRLQPVQLGIQLPAKPRPVKAPDPGVPAIAGGIADLIRIGRGEDHDLLGHAPPDDAGATHAVFLGQRHPRLVVTRGDASRAHAA